MIGKDNERKEVQKKKILEINQELNLGFKLAKQFKYLGIWISDQLPLSPNIDHL